MKSPSVCPCRKCELSWLPVTSQIVKPGWAWLSACTSTVSRRPYSETAAPSTVWTMMPLETTFRAVPSTACGFCSLSPNVSTSFYAHKSVPFSSSADTVQSAAPVRFLCRLWSFNRPENVSLLPHQSLWWKCPLWMEKQIIHLNRPPNRKKASWECFQIKQLPNTRTVSLRLNWSRRKWLNLRYGFTSCSLFL